MENNTWVLIANASQARIYSLCKVLFLQTGNHKTLTLEKECEHLESRKKGKDLLADKPSRLKHNTVQVPNPKEHEAERFAIELAGALDHARKDNQYRELIIMAPPTFLGLLKKHLTGDMHKKVSLMIEKDYTTHNEKQLVTDLESHL